MKLRDWQEAAVMGELPDGKMIVREWFHYGQGTSSCHVCRVDIPQKNESLTVYILQNGSPDITSWDICLNCPAPHLTRL